MWLNAILDFLKSIYYQITLWVVVDEYDRAIILRLGKYKRTLEPGLSFKFPFIDNVLSATVVIATFKIEEQTFHTKDDIQVCVSTIVRYSIRHIKPYLLEIVHREDILGDVVPGVVKSVGNSLSYRRYMESTEETELKQIRNKVNRYGFHIHEITHPTKAKIKTIRLITTQPIEASA